MVKLAPVWLAHWFEMHIWIVKIIFPQKMASGAALVLFDLHTFRYGLEVTCHHICELQMKKK